MNKVEFFKTILETPRFIKTALHRVFDIDPNSVLLGGFSPSSIGQGLLAFWTKAINIPRTEWNTPDHQLNNEVDTLPPNRWNQGLDFTAASSDYIQIPALSPYNTIQFWVKIDSANEMLFGFAGFSQRVSVVANVITYGGLAGTQTTYVDGALTTTLPSDGEWHHVRSISSVAVTNAIDLAFDDNVVVYGDISLKDFSLGLNVEDNYAMNQSELVAFMSTCSAFYPLADYDIADGVRTAGDELYDYSGNNSHGYIEGTSVTPIYTPDIGFEVEEGKFNLVSEQYRHDRGDGLDILGNSITPYTGSEAPDGQLFTGGGISFTVANADYIQVPTQEFTSSFSFCMWYNSTSGSFNYVLSENGTTNYIRINNGNGEFTLRSNGFLAITGTGLNVAGWHFIVCSIDVVLDEMKLWVDGTLIDTRDISANDIETGGFTFNRINQRNNGAYSTIEMSDYAVFNKVLTSDDADYLWNNPNKFVEFCQDPTNQCVLAYDFSGGIYEAGSPVIDVSGNGNHGTVQGATAEMALNNIELGSQMALHGWTAYPYFNNVFWFDTGIKPDLSGDFDVKVTYFRDAYSTSNSLLGSSTAGGNKEFDIRFTAANSITVDLDDNVNGGDTLIKIIVDAINIINEIRVLRVGTDLSIYLNGVQQGVTETFASDLTPTVNNWLIGSFGGLASSRKFQGGYIFSIEIVGQHKWEWSGQTYIDIINKTAANRINDISDVNIIIPSISDIATTDIFGNTVSRPWKKGLLNFTPLSHGGAVLGTTGDFDYSKYTLVSLWLMKAVSAARQVFLSNRTAGDGVTYSQLASELVDLENEVSATSANDSADTTLTVGNYVIASTIESDGLTEHYLGDDSTPIASDSTPTRLNGQVGQSSGAMTIGALVDKTLPVNEGAMSILFYNKKISLIDLEKLRKYLIKLIP